MKRIRQIIGSDKTPARSTTSSGTDEGFTLIEVIVAMLVFTIISITVAASITNSLVIAKDSRSRTIAVNLASQDLDQARAVTDVFQVVSKTWTTTVQGVAYTIARDVEWHGATTTATACGTGDGTLQYKIVTDTVSYPGAGTTDPVVSATVLAPNSRINDPSYGTIIVAVTGSTGAGVAGVTVTVTPSSTNANGATAVTTAPALTDSNGCSYALKVVPGNYNVTITAPGGIDYTQATSPTRAVTITAGNAQSIPFSYDTAASFTLKYASNYTAPAGTTVSFPTNLTTSFSSSVGGPFTKTIGAGGSATVSLYPVSYTYESGSYVAPIVGTTGTVTNSACVNPDAGAWSTANSAKAVGTSFSMGTTPGGTATVKVPMGVITLPSLSGVLGFTATAVNSTANGDPGCAAGTTYTFAAVNNVPTIALPFGTWKLTVISALGKLTTITPTATAIQTGGVVNSDSSFTLDPRGVTP